MRGLRLDQELRTNCGRMREGSHGIPFSYEALQIHRTQAGPVLEGLAADLLRLMAAAALPTMQS